MFFATVSIPTVLTATQDHRPYPSARREQQLPQRNFAWQVNLMQRMFGVTQQEDLIATRRVVAEPRPLRRQVEPVYRISLRKRFTDTLNSPFHYEMSEAARVVL
ncbi:unnamed protein product [Cylindrotheca closterium]|uniref:Uncharacterized protein n=1 Tax=Cylindrotheca closterium TaxID=2856 RepID=A0AAD2CIF3_9STRA|nr:unnamed protein product [Cylindrotheca closterium]